MNSIKLQFGDVRQKSIVTPNQFVSHMIEHIAWRLGAQIKLVWKNTDWGSLGLALGKEIAKFPSKQKSGIAFGMIDDGSAEVLVKLKEKGLDINSEKQVNPQWFLSSRCEQLASGQPLVDLLKGLSEGLNAKIALNICSFEDPHHTWEGVFRGVGIALSKVFTPSVKTESKIFKDKTAVKSTNSSGAIIIKQASLDSAVVFRKTAETEITIGVYFDSKRKNRSSILVDKSINVKGSEKLFFLLGKQAGFRLDINFNAKVLSSSHVVMEDVGLVLGRALLEIFKLRMETEGSNGSGSNLISPDNFKKKPVTVGLSVEGRKFCQIISNLDYTVIRRRLLVGQNIMGNLRSEDLDDFLDGLSGGMGCSLIINLKKLLKPQDFWAMVFVGIGQALKEAFEANPYRKGVPPGVKANLA